MPLKSSITTTQISIETARNIWIWAQRLDQPEPFGRGPDAVHAAISHLGYVQIDVINVIERCHHHILFNRIPAYQRQDLAAAQSGQKSIFEYWTHALSYLPVEAFPFYTAQMCAHFKDPMGWGGQTSSAQFRKVSQRLKHDGPLAISDFKDDTLKEKTHLWASKKPSKSALEAGFYAGKFTISKRKGVEKYYDLTERHFGWEKLPKSKTETQILNYELDRALTAQGFVCLNSICHLVPSKKPSMMRIIEKRIRAKTLTEVQIGLDDKTRYFISPDLLECDWSATSPLTHILSPFDPLAIQRKRTKAIFAHDHIFEAYVPPQKRKWGYFTLPVLSGNRIVAGIDLKTDRHNDQLLIQAWHWFEEADQTRDKQKIEDALGRFETFQFAELR